MKIQFTFIVLTLLFAACKKSDAPPPVTPITPVVKVLAALSASSITAITINTATAGGNITSDGGSAVTARGICYAITTNPTIANTVVGAGTGSGAFTAAITRLKANTTYYFRAFATNAVGTAYSAQVSFLTLYPTTIKDVQNNIYQTVKIGNQVWMAENLKTLKYRDGLAIPFIMSWRFWANNTAGASCDYENRPDNAVVYGRLYNWAAINNPKIAPDGWHVPTDADWDELISKLGGAPVAGGSLKENTFNYWFMPNAAANNNSGFKGLPGGYCDIGNPIFPTQHFYEMKQSAYWWSATTSASDLTKAGFLRLSYDNSIANTGQVSKGFGLSVRCIMDK